MAGKKISRANMAHIHAAAEHLHAVGANYPGRGDTAIGKADMSLGEQISAVASAVYRANDMATSSYCYVEEVFDSYVIIEAGDTHYRADYSTADDGAITLSARDSWVEVEEVWQPVSSSAAKAGLLLQDTQATHYASIKALGDRQLEVLVSYYGHKDGKDSHGEYFSPRTDFAVEDFPTPPLLYYHGYDETNRKMSKPIVTGKFVSRRSTPQGHALLYQLKSGKYADLQWAAALKGECVVSPGTVGHLIRKSERDGELLYWPLAEVSAWDYSDKRKPANLHSVAAPVLKALYLSEGLTLPTSITANDPTPETPGDGVSAADPHAADVSPDEAARMVTSHIVAALLTRTMRNT